MDYVFNDLTGKMRPKHPLEGKHVYKLLWENTEKMKENYIKEFGRDKMYYKLFPPKLFD